MMTTETTLFMMNTTTADPMKAEISGDGEDAWQGYDPYMMVFVMVATACCLLGLSSTLYLLHKYNSDTSSSSNNNNNRSRHSRQRNNNNNRNHSRSNSSSSTYSRLARLVGRLPKEVLVFVTAGGKYQSFPPAADAGDRQAEAVARAAWLLNVPLSDTERSPVYRPLTEPLRPAEQIV
ncbi:uncharacterized protein LOC143290180 [Babylonia areolata]|uniref:uncharacterized protein LOC143290180 n=1 Tax=Babylonia areolata TaxID=304850 RepID=UPI003FD19E83